MIILYTVFKRDIYLSRLKQCIGNASEDTHNPN